MILKYIINFYVRDKLLARRVFEYFCANYFQKYIAKLAVKIPLEW